MRINKARCQKQTARIKDLLTSPGLQRTKGNDPVSRNAHGTGKGLCAAAIHHEGIADQQVLMLRFSGTGAVNGACCDSKDSQQERKVKKKSVYAAVFIRRHDCAGRRGGELAGGVLVHKAHSLGSRVD
jgi:hypothetical protein